MSHHEPHPDASHDPAPHAATARGPTFEKEAWRPLKLDFEHYAQFVADQDWSDEQKRTFLEAVWTLIVQVVDMKMRIHPVQQAQSPLVPDSTPMLDSGPNT